MKYIWAPSHLEGPSGEGAHGPKGPKRGGRLGELPGSFPPPPWRSPREEETLGRSPRAAPSSKGGSPPPPAINRADGGTPSTHKLFPPTPKGCPLSLPLLDPIS